MVILKACGAVYEKNNKYPNEYSIIIFIKKCK